MILATAALCAAVAACVKMESPGPDENPEPVPPDPTESYDRDLDTDYLIGTLMHQDGAPLYQKLVYFSDKPYGEPGCSCIIVNMLDEKPDTKDDLGLAAGQYDIIQSGDAGTIWDAVFFKSNSSNTGYAIDPVSLVEGTLEVSDENGQMRYELVFKDKAGKSYHASHTGNLVLSDRTGNSTVDEDMELSLSSLYGELTYYGTMSSGADGWHICLTTSGDAGVELSLDLYSDPSNIDSGLPDGVYTASSEKTAGTFVPGYKGNTLIVGSWFTNFRGESVYAPSAPLTGGTVTVRQSSPGFYELEIDCQDDALFPHKLTGTWKGYVDLYDASL